MSSPEARLAPKAFLIVPLVASLLMIAPFTVDAYPDLPFGGNVSEIRNSPTTVQNVVTYDVIVKVDPPVETKPARRSSLMPLN